MNLKSWNKFWNGGKTQIFQLWKSDLIDFRMRNKHYNVNSTKFLCNSNAKWNLLTKSTNYPFFNLYMLSRNVWLALRDFVIVLDFSLLNLRWSSSMKIKIVEFGLMRTASRTLLPWVMSNLKDSLYWKFVTL